MKLGTFACHWNLLGVMGGETFFKVESTNASRKTIEIFCGLNWQLQRHKHGNMTSLVKNRCKFLNTFCEKSCVAMTTFQRDIHSIWLRTERFFNTDWLIVFIPIRAGLRGGNGGNCPGSSAPRGPTAMTFICFKYNIRLKNCRDSTEIQEYNSILWCCSEYH